MTSLLTAICIILSTWFIIIIGHIHTHIQNRNAYINKTTHGYKSLQQFTASKLALANYVQQKHDKNINKDKTLHTRKNNTQDNNTVDDVSAQCVISPDLTTLTIANGLTRDVEFHCQCMDGNARWLFSNGTLAPTQNFNIPPAVLRIYC